MEVIEYKLLSKKENDQGVSLTFQKTEECLTEVWVDAKPQTFLEKCCSLFGMKTGRWSSDTEVDISEFDVFYPKSKHGVARTTDMCYSDGQQVSFELQQQLLRIVEMASFKEKPVDHFEAKAK
jgi:hypothetical protein